MWVRGAPRPCEGAADHGSETGPRISISPSLPCGELAIRVRFLTSALGLPLCMSNALRGIEAIKEAGVVYRGLAQHCPDKRFERNDLPFPRTTIYLGGGELNAHLGRSHGKPPQQSCAISG